MLAASFDLLFCGGRQDNVSATQEVGGAEAATPATVGSPGSNPHATSYSIFDSDSLASQREVIMAETKAKFQYALPFAMEPVVYDFSINSHGTKADLLTGAGPRLPASYYQLTDAVREDQASQI